MFQTAIGRIHSHIKSLPKTLELKIFIDAGGKAGHKRVWGGLAIIGDQELAWIEQGVDDINGNNKNGAELKGRDLPTSEIVIAGRKIIEQKRRILFWANWFPEWRNQDVQNISSMLAGILKSMKPNKNHIEQRTINMWYQNIAQYFSNLKAVNKYKIISIITHLHWLIAEISKTEIGLQLKSVELIIDRENFPDEEKCGILIKFFLSAGLQSSGMDYSLTGKAHKELANQGAISVNASGDSKNCAGIIFVDILLQAVLRKVMPIS